LPTFIIPKKDSTVCTVSDFRELNKCVVRKPYPIPKISMTLKELDGFNYATALELSMGYCTIRRTQQHLRCELSSSLGEYTPIRDFPWALEAQPTYSKPK
jgi:hypothetical protein